MEKISERELNSKFRIVDTHAHLDGVKDIEGAIRRAVETGIYAIVAVSSDSESCREILRIAERYSGESIKIYPALGIHPWSLLKDDLESALKFIEERIDQAIAVGEVGLDYWLKEAKKNPEFKDMQKKALQKFLEIAERHDKAVLIHSRGAWRDSYEIVKESNVERVIFHWFSGPEDVLFDVLDSGYYISATPAAQYSKAHREAIGKAPLSRIVLETDSPVRYMGEEAEPSHILKALKAVAEIKRVEEDDVAEQTTRNAVQILKIEKPT